MAKYDEQGRWMATPITKGEGKAKKAKGTEKPSKLVARDGKPDLEAAVAAVKPKGGAGPRRSGNRVERLVAQSIGGERTVGSGAYKHSNRNLTGDVEVRDNEGRDFLKLEIKASGTISAKGEKSYSIKQPELKQMKDEAEANKELGALIFHFKGESIENSWVIMPYSHFKEMVEDAKLGRTARL